MSDGDSEAVDLFGDPWRELPDRRGRPKHRITDENRNKVKALRAAGWPQREIAAALGCSEPTLREYYFSELDEGAIEERAEALMALRHEALVERKVAALKAYLQILAAGDTLPKVKRPASDAPVDAPQGKKATLQREAEVGHETTSWGSLLPN